MPAPTVLAARSGVVDPQLERAVAEAMRLLETQSVEILPEAEAPVRARRLER